MSCCGQKRQRVAEPTHRAEHSESYHAAKASIVPAGSILASKAISSPTDRSLSVTLRYRSRSTVIVLGSTTGRRYQFSGGGWMQAVDRRDAEVLVASGLFERIGS
jgi:hypothetical protein